MNPDPRIERDPILRIDSIAREDPDRPCLQVAVEGLSYQRVKELSCRVAGAMVACGLGAGKRVAILSPNHALGMVTTLGILRAGATWLPLNPRDSAAQTATLLHRFGCDALIFHSEFESILPELRAQAQRVQTVVCLDSDNTSAPSLFNWMEAHSAPVPPNRDPDGLAAVFATGGTTGEPRGVRFNYGTLSTIAHYLRLMLEPYDPRPVFLAAAPLTHVSGRACLGVMAAGGTTVILPRFEAGEVLRSIPEHRVTFLITPPTMLSMLLADADVRRYDYSSLSSIFVGAAPLPVELLKRALEVFGPVVFQAYGQTEAPMFIARKQPGDDLVDGELAPDQRLVSCGRATAFSEIQVLGPEFHPLPPGEIGEIGVRGDFIMDGYDSDPDGTLATSAGSFHRTGDLGFVDEEGFLTITGRATDMIISGGFNVYPAEVEGVLAELPEVGASAVFGLPDAKWGEVVVAAIEPARGQQVDVDAVLQHARARLGGVKAPKRGWVVPELPRNANGKILKRDLVERLADAG